MFVFADRVITKGVEMCNLVDGNGRLDYTGLLRKYPWIVERDLNCILSPDSDGLLCGLLMQSLLNWNIVGFYDGKVMALKSGCRASDCIFLDMEIFRDFIKSIGQHMLMWNSVKDLQKPEWANFNNCISPNNIRKFDGKTKFKCKYPLGTIHLLLGILGSRFNICIKQEAVCPLLYTDGTFKSMFNYPENVLDWLDFLSAGDETSPLYKVFFDNTYSTSALMKALKDFFANIKNISVGRRGGDKIQISDKDGNYKNFVQNENATFDLEQGQRDVADRFLELLSQLTGWVYNSDKWVFENFNLYSFSKGAVRPNNRNFDALVARMPISWAMTAGSRIEYTVEDRDVLN